MRRLICAFFVRLWQKQVFSWRGSNNHRATSFSTDKQSTKSNQSLLTVRFFWWLYRPKADSENADQTESSTGAHVISLVLSCSGAFDNKRIFAAMLYTKWAASWQNKQCGLCAQRTHISLGIHPVWSESSLSAWRHFGCWATHWAHSEDSD